MIRRYALLALVALLAALPATACLSPTLPLPPPDPPETMSAGTDGTWELRGGCTPGAVVLVKNLATGVIAGTEDRDHDGRYFVRVGATECDGAEVYELVGSTSTDHTFFIIEETVAGVAAGHCE